MTDIREKIEEWRRNLLDLSKRNALIKCPMGARGAVEIRYPHAENVWQNVGIRDGRMTFVWKRDLVDTDLLPFESLQEADGDADDADNQRTEHESEREPKMEECLASPRLQADHLLTELNDRKLDLRLRRLSVRAKEALSEQGVHTLFLAFGMLRWFESIDSKVELLSPLMLVPVKLERRSADAPWTIAEYEDEVIPNHSLQQLLQEEFGLQLPALPALADLEAPGARNEFLSEVRLAIADSQRWEVRDTLALGAFSFQKIAMWQDLGENWEQIAGHSLCRAVAGDESAVVSEAAEVVPAEELDDRTHPADLHTILDCDSSQLEGILAAKAGRSLVLDGPPGTGKSQTIA